MDKELIEVKGCSEEGYHPLVFFEGWRVALLNDTPRFHLDQINEMQRHNTSDEVFLLLEGSFTLYAADDKEDGPGDVSSDNSDRAFVDLQTRLRKKNSR